MSDKHGRRGFFKAALNQILQPVADILDERTGPVPTVGTSAAVLLRPPGALPEEEFLEKCLRCGNCVKNCPAEAIRPLESEDPGLMQTPYINPTLQPCVICDSLACMYVCPSGALQSVFAEDIAMGTAVFTAETCLRSKEITCTYCVDSCPIGEEAIRFSPTGMVEVLMPGCTGCGVCQHVCPTSPKSIVIEPLRQSAVGAV